MKSDRGAEHYLALIRGYIDEGRGADVRRATKGVCSYNSLTNWIDDPEKLNRSPIVRKGGLKLIWEKLAPKTEHQRTYDFLRDQMNMQAESQYDLQNYEGPYNIRHNIDEQKISLRKLHVRIAMSPFFPFYNCAVREKRLGKEISDGYVFLSDAKLVFAGLSEYINNFFVFNKVVNLEKDIMEGVITVQDRLNNACYISSALLMHKSHKKQKTLFDRELGGLNIEL